MSYRVKIYKTKLRYNLLDTFNFLEKDFDEYNFTLIKEVDCAITFESDLEGVISNLDVEDGDYIEILNCKVGKYFYIIDKENYKHALGKRVRIYLDVIAQYGKQIHSDLENELVLIERKHCKRFKYELISNTNSGGINYDLDETIIPLNNKGKLTPLFDELWYGNFDFNDTLSNNAEYLFRDFDFDYKITNQLIVNDGFDVGLSGNEEAKMWNHENTDMQFATNNTMHMNLRETGQLGIGTDFVPAATSKKLTLVLDSEGDGIWIANKESLYPAASTGYSDLRFTFRDYLTGGFTNGGEAIVRGYNENAPGLTMKTH